MIYLLTVTEFSPGGSTQLQTIHRTTQITTEQHKYKLMWKSAGRAQSLRVLPWHLRYEEKTRKNFSHGTKNVSQVKKTLSQSTVYILHNT
jgi:hypothetical protein